MASHLTYSTQNALSLLSQYDDFRDAEVQRIIKAAYLENEHIRWILGDRDVDCFAEIIVPLGKTANTRALSSSLRELLNQLGPAPVLTTHSKSTSRSTQLSEARSPHITLEI